MQANLRDGILRKHYVQNTQIIQLARMEIAIIVCRIIAHNTSPARSAWIPSVPA